MMNTIIAEVPKHPSPHTPEPSQSPRIQQPTIYVYEQQRWEYQVVTKAVEDDATISTEELNTLGKDGWELVGVVTLPAKVQCFFKRLKL